MIQVTNRSEKPYASLLVPTLIELDLGKCLCLSFLRCMVNGRSRLEILADVLCQETRGHGRKCHCYVTPLKVRQGNGSLPRRAFFRQSDFDSAQCQVTSEQRYVLCQVEVRIHEGQIIYIW